MPSNTPVLRPIPSYELRLEGAPRRTFYSCIKDGTHELVSIRSPSMDVYHLSRTRPEVANRTLNLTSVTSNLAATQLRGLRDRLKRYKWALWFTMFSLSGSAS